MSDFVKFKKFRNALRAEMAGHALDQYDIPYMVKDNDILFGEGTMTEGVALWVAEDKMDEAHKILDDIVSTLPPDEPETETEKGATPDA